jgi:hypothetical protein
MASETERLLEWDLNQPKPLDPSTHARLRAKAEAQGGDSDSAVGRRVVMMVSVFLAIMLLTSQVA